MTRHEVPARLWAEWAAAHNQFRRARAFRRARTVLLLEAAGDADEIEVDGVVVATVSEGRVRYIPPCARSQEQQREEER